MATAVEQLGSAYDESAQSVATVVIYWIPLGAAASVVRTSGKLFEAVSAILHGRERAALYHSALEVFAPGRAHRHRDGTGC